jgi:uncharacterized membrane protein
LAVLLLLPYLTADDEPAGAWFLSDRGRHSAGIAALAALATTPAAVVAHDIALRAWPGATTWLTGGVLPVAVIGSAAYGFVMLSRARFGLTRNETVQAAVVLGGVAFAVLTVVGIWFRGPGMSLVWPWAR